MNTYIYKLENDVNFYNNDENSHIINLIDDNEARNVWIVKIRHPENTAINEKSVNKEYYVDATTEEIIGGREL